MTEFDLSSNPRFLLVRTDAIGDVLLTTPAVSSLRKKYPNSFIAFLCRSYTAPLLDNNPAISLILKEDEHSFLELANKLKELKFHAAIHFYIDTRAVFATWLSRVPVRVGPYSKWPALLLNHRMIQHRSRVLKHEAEYNLDLVKECGADGAPCAPTLFLTEQEKRRGKEILTKIQKNPEKRPILLHPGSGGSVQNWPLDHFLNLAQKIVQEFRNSGEVLFTAGKGEEQMIGKVKNLSSQIDSIHTVAPGSLTLRELAAIISQARLMISNSTGPLHMANALGIPTLSFYPRVPKVTSAARWGPFANPHLNHILSPENDFAPLASISVETAFNKLKQLLQQS